MYRRNYRSNPPAPQPTTPAPKPRDFPRMALTVADLMDELRISWRMSWWKNRASPPSRWESAS